MRRDPETRSASRVAVLLARFGPELAHQHLQMKSALVLVRSIAKDIAPPLTYRNPIRLQVPTSRLERCRKRLRRPRAQRHRFLQRENASQDCAPSREVYWKR